MAALISILFISYLIYLSIQAARWLWLLIGFPELEPLREKFIVDQTPLVSVIVPARNEEAYIERCLNSIRTQEYPMIEVLVVGDESTDRTAALVQQFQPPVTLLRNPPLPHEWVGKSWACYNGFLLSKGDWLLFTDADSVLCPGSVSAAIYYAIQHKVDMLTVWPLMEMESFWEKLILPIVFRYFFVDFKGRFVNDPASPTWAAFGMYILIKREIYTAVGGHAAIRMHTDEDYRLAKMVKKSGFRLRVVRGHSIIRKRMYENFSSMWEGACHR